VSLSIERALRESGSDTNEYYEDTSAGITLKQTIRKKYTLSAEFTYGENEYNLPIATPREDDNYNGGIDLEYEIQKWLSAGVGYTYAKKDSNLVANDYTDNQFMILLKGTY
jgi:uncharacterized protein (PEP-CTERM system associated)